MGATRCVLCLFGLFGTVFLVFAFVPVFYNVIRAGGWTPTPCRIISSHVKSHTDRHGVSTYGIDVAYSYTVNGREYNSDRYQFLDYSSGEYLEKAAIVNRLAPGTMATCYVDSSDPTQAVIQRGWTPDMAFVLLPLGFMLLGVIGFVSVLRQRNFSYAVPPAPAG